MSRDPSTTNTTVVTKYIAIFAAAILAACLVWGLRRLIVPVFVGGLLAYICRPLVARLERYRIPRGLAVGLLLLMFGGLTLVGLNSVHAAIPDEVAVLELRVRVLYALNHRYRALMGLDYSWRRGNRLYRLTHRDLDPLLDRVSEWLTLSSDERDVFVASRERRTDPVSDGSSRLFDYERANTEASEMRAGRTGRAEPAPRSFGGSAWSAVPSSGTENEPVAPGSILSTWMISPVIFLFLLWDTGSIKRGLLTVVPNRFFEPALAVLDDIDQALGNYVRGIFLECCALGLTVVVFLAIVGVPLRWAIAIGIFTGASNVVPYMGFAAALLCGLGYALLAEEIHPLIPLVSAETFAIWVVLAVALAELLKNVVYEPIVLGGAVKLHPLVVVLGVVGGAILFGPAGMMLAIPAITIVRVLVASSVRHLKAYGLV